MSEMTSVDWVYLQTAIHFPPKGTTETSLQFGKFKFTVLFDELTVKVFYVASNINSNLIGEFLFLEKEDLTYFYHASSYVYNFPVKDWKKFTLQELFSFLEKANRLALTPEYQFLAKHDR